MLPDHHPMPCPLLSLHSNPPFNNTNPTLNSQPCPPQGNQNAHPPSPASNPRPSLASLQQRQVINRAGDDPTWRATGPFQAGATDRDACMVLLHRHRNARMARPQWPPVSGRDTACGGGEFGGFGRWWVGVPLWLQDGQGSVFFFFSVVVLLLGSSFFSFRGGYCVRPEGCQVPSVARRPDCQSP
ncbi:hypothetical protein B0I37DRAFT_1759 [Chaetomium sp. MPI-CAGE-AT-0009]|nr:hypothetical protein B0I37DRAFT_1759 [Chaetomium sp. MPI-CAGE-AT-0009]